MKLRLAVAIISGALIIATPAKGQWRQGLTDRGLDSLRVAARRDSVDAEAWYRLGLGLWEKRRYDQADSAFQKAVAFQPTHAGAHLALSALPFGRGARYLFDLPGRVGRDSALAVLAAAQRHGRDAYLDDPTVDLAPLRFLADEDLAPRTVQYLCPEGFCAGASTDRRWWRPTQQGARSLVTGRADSAFAAMGRLLAARRPDEVVPDDFVWFFALAADRSGHPAEAAEGFRELAQRATRRESGSPEVGVAPRSRPMYLYLYGVALARAGNRAVARAVLHEALLADLTLFQVHSRLAEIAEARGETDEAITERRSAIDIAPELSRLHVDLGITLLQMGRTEEARAAFEVATTQAPRDPVAQLFLFQAALTLKDRAVAEQALASLERYAPLRNREQVAEARRRLSELP